MVNIFRKMWSKKQIKDLISDSPSEVLQALQDQDLKVKTIEQSQANWSYDITSFPNITGGTATPIFCRVQQINKELHIVMLGKIENETENVIEDYGTSTSINVNLPEEIASKIYDVLGHKVSETLTEITRVSYNFASASLSNRSDMSKYFADVVMNILNNVTPNQISIIFQRPSKIQIPAGQTCYFESRVSLDLI